MKITLHSALESIKHPLSRIEYLFCKLQSGVIFPELDLMPDLYGLHTNHCSCNSHQDRLNKIVAYSEEKPIQITNCNYTND